MTQHLKCLCKLRERHTAAERQLLYLKTFFKRGDVMEQFSSLDAAILLEIQDELLPWP